MGVNINRLIDDPNLNQEEVWGLSMKLGIKRKHLESLSETGEGVIFSILGKSKELKKKEANTCHEYLKLSLEKALIKLEFPNRALNSFDFTPHSIQLLEIKYTNYLKQLGTKELYQKLVEKEFKKDLVDLILFFNTQVYSVMINVLENKISARYFGFKSLLSHILISSQEKELIIESYDTLSEEIKVVMRLLPEQTVVFENLLVKLDKCKSAELIT